MFESGDRVRVIEGEEPTGIVGCVGVIVIPSDEIEAEGYVIVQLDNAIDLGGGDCRRIFAMPTDELEAL
jgi:hypothetical protein